jgi:hypothetical protein
VHEFPDAKSGHGDEAAAAVHQLVLIQTEG